MHFGCVVVFCNYENRQDADLGLLFPKADLHDHGLRCFLILWQPRCAGSPPKDQTIIMLVAGYDFDVVCARFNPS